MGMKIKKNGKIISLSESDLKRITSVVLREETEADGEKGYEKCCKDAGIDVPKYCKQGDPGQCIAELAKMLSSDPLGTGMSVLTAINCVKENSKGGKLTNPNGKLTKNTYKK